MSQQGGDFDGGTLLNRIKNRDPELGQFLQDFIDSHNRVATNAGVSPTGDVQAPKPPDAVNVKTSGEFMHIAINHSGPIQRNVRYFSEISTSPSFGQPLVVDHGASRTSHPIQLPTKDDDGNNHTYYVRSYAQYPGGPPSQVTPAQGSFTMSGATHMTLLPSTGSGTAPNNGQSAGQGLGRFQKRGS